MNSKLLNHVRLTLKGVTEETVKASLETDLALAIFGQTDPKAPELKETIDKLRKRVDYLNNIVDGVEKELNK